MCLLKNRASVEPDNSFPFHDCLILVFTVVNPRSADTSLCLHLNMHKWEATLTTVFSSLYRVIHSSLPC